MALSNTTPTDTKTPSDNKPLAYALILGWFPPLLEMLLNGIPIDTAFIIYGTGNLILGGCLLTDLKLPREKVLIGVWVGVWLLYFYFLRGELSELKKDLVHIYCIFPCLSVYSYVPRATGASGPELGHLRFFPWQLSIYWSG